MIEPGYQEKVMAQTLFETMLVHSHTSQAITEGELFCDFEYYQRLIDQYLVWNKQLLMDMILSSPIVPVTNALILRYLTFGMELSYEELRILFRSATFDARFGGEVVKKELKDHLSLRLQLDMPFKEMVMLYTFCHAGAGDEFSVYATASKRKLSEHVSKGMTHDQMLLLVQHMPVYLVSDYVAQYLSEQPDLSLRQVVELIGALYTDDWYLYGDAKPLALPLLLERFAAFADEEKEDIALSPKQLLPKISYYSVSKQLRSYLRWVGSLFEMKPYEELYELAEGIDHAAARNMFVAEVAPYALEKETFDAWRQLVSLREDGGPYAFVILARCTDAESLTVIDWRDALSGIEAPCEECSISSKYFVMQLYRYGERK